jgi:hypothetical protein
MAPGVTSHEQDGRAGVVADHAIVHRRELRHDRPDALHRFL